MFNIQKSPGSDHARTIARQQTAAAIATGLDFVIYVGLVELFSVWYVLSAALGALAGAYCSFMLGRHWCFAAQDGHITQQGTRFIVVSGGSLILNTAGVWIFTDILGLHYVASKLTIAITVSLFYNYPLQRYYVFRRSNG